MFEIFFRDRLVQLLSSSMYVCVVVVYNIFWLSVPLAGLAELSSFLLMHLSIITAQQNWVGVALN